MSARRKIRLQEVMIQRRDNHIEMLTDTLDDVALLFPSISAPTPTNWHGVGEYFYTPAVRYGDIKSAAASIRAEELAKADKAADVRAKRLVDDLRSGKISEPRKAWGGAVVAGPPSVPLTREELAILGTVNARRNTAAATVEIVPTAAELAADEIRRIIRRETGDIRSSMAVNHSESLRDSADRIASVLKDQLSSHSLKDTGARFAGLAADNPASAEDVSRYAGLLRGLLTSLDREIVDAALVGESEGDLLHSEREEVERVREFLDGRILVPLQLDGRRGRALALLDAFADEFESGKGHGVSPSSSPKVAESNSPG